MTFPRASFDADRGYDADYNFEELFWMGMVPNIKQRMDSTSAGAYDLPKEGGRTV